MPRIRTTQLARGNDVDVAPTIGDILIATASGYIFKAIGASGTFLRSDGTTADWATLATGGVAPNTVDYLVGTASGALTAEIVAGTTPGGELGGTWASPTVDATHSGSAHHDPNHVLTAYKDADQEVTDTTLASDSELTVTLALNGKYQFKFDLFFLNDGAAEGIKVSLAGTATVTDIKAQVSIYDDTTNALVAFARITALGGAGVGAGISTGSNYVTIEGAIEITTAGTFLLQFAQNAAGINAGVHCEVGSSLVVVKLE